MKGIDIPAKFWIKRNSGDPILCEGINMIEGDNTGWTVELIDGVLNMTSKVVVNGAVSTIMNSNVTPDKALISDGTGKIAVDPVIDKIELESLDNVSANVQNQLNMKISVAKSLILGRNTATVGTLVTRYVDLYFNTISTQEADSKNILSNNCNLSRLSIKVRTNTTNSDTVITLRKNGVDTNLSITIPAGQTGVFNDDVDVISFSASDEANFKIIAGGGILTTIGDFESSLLLTI